MLCDKPWRGEAILRLLLSLFITSLMGSVAIAALQVFRASQHVHLEAFCALATGCWLCCGGALFILRKRLELESFMLNLLLIMVLAYVGLVLGAFALKAAPQRVENDDAWRVVIAALSFQGAAIALTIPFTHQQGASLRDAFGLSSNWKRAALYGVLVSITFLPVGLGLQWASAEIMNYFGHKAVTQAPVEALEISRGWFDRSALAFVAIVLAPIAEETLFRGILYPAIKQRGFPRLALWGTSLAFAAIHFNLPTFVPLLVLALALTWLYETTDNLLAPIVAHGCFNALNFALFFLQQSQLG